MCACFCKVKIFSAIWNVSFPKCYLSAPIGALDFPAMDIWNKIFEIGIKHDVSKTFSATARAWSNLEQSIKDYETACIYLSLMADYEGMAKRVQLFNNTHQATKAVDNKSET